VLPISIKSSRSKYIVRYMATRTAREPEDLLDLAVLAKHGPQVQPETVGNEIDPLINSQCLPEYIEWDIYPIISCCYTVTSKGAAQSHTDCG
jgi:hypothetical protein